jgi:hypothetical protein
LKQPALLLEFRNSLKNPWAEELIDLVLFRPVAFLFVKLAQPLPITPNQISFLAMAAGITGGVAFAGGDRLHFVLGAVFYGLANILDCCDGMIARLKKNGTMTGRIVDGCTDYVIGTAVYCGFAVGLSKAVHIYGVHLPCNEWFLMVMAAISLAAHSFMSDKYRNAFLIQNRETNESPDDEIERFKIELKRLEGQGGHLFDRVLIRIYLRYMRLQSGRIRSPKKQSPLKRLKRIGPMNIVLWNLIGPSTHVFILIISAFLNMPMLFFVFVIGLANLWMIILLLLFSRSATLE